MHLVKFFSLFLLLSVSLSARAVITLDSNSDLGHLLFSGIVASKDRGSVDSLIGDNEKGGKRSGLVSLLGDTVVFTYDESLLGLYGKPSVKGDALIFSPTSLFADNNKGGLGYLNESLSIHITSRDDSPIHNMGLSYLGSYLNTISDKESYVRGTSKGKEALASARIAASIMGRPALSVLVADHQSSRHNESSQFSGHDTINLTSVVATNIDISLRSILSVTMQDGNENARNDDYTHWSKNWISLSQITLTATAFLPHLNSVPLPGSTWFFLFGLMVLLGVNKSINKKLWRQV